MRGARALAALGFALVLALAPAVRAADDPFDPRVEGRRRFEAGEQYFQKGQYASALVEYEAGYQLTRLPGFLINIAHCHRLSGDQRKARAFYRKYLLVEPASPRKAEVEDIIRKLDESLALGAAGPEVTTSKDPKTPSVRWWLWSALASSVVGSTVANMALAASEEKR